MLPDQPALMARASLQSRSFVLGCCPAIILFMTARLLADARALHGSRSILSTLQPKPPQFAQKQSRPACQSTCDECAFTRGKWK